MEKRTKGQGGHNAPKVHNGTYVIQREGKPTSKFVVRLHTVTNPESKLFGKRIVSLKVDGESTGVAFWDEGLEGCRVWKRHSSLNSSNLLRAFRWDDERWNQVEKKLALWMDLALTEKTPQRGSYWRPEGYFFELSGLCVRCNRELTNPESIRTGIGPVCAGRE